MQAVLFHRNPENRSGCGLFSGANHVSTVDLSANPIDDFAAIVDGIFYPIISNPRNPEGWPDVIKKDVDSHFHDLRSIITKVGW